MTHFSYPIWTTPIRRCCFAHQQEPCAPRCDDGAVHVGRSFEAWRKIHRYRLDRETQTATLIGVVNSEGYPSSAELRDLPVERQRDELVTKLGVRFRIVGAAQDEETFERESLASA